MRLKDKRQLKEAAVKVWKSMSNQPTLCWSQWLICNHVSFIHFNLLQNCLFQCSLKNVSVVTKGARLYLFFNISRYKYQQIKSELSSHILLLILNSNVVSVEQKQMNWPSCSSTFGRDCIWIYDISVLAVYHSSLHSTCSKAHPPPHHEQGVKLLWKKKNIHTGVFYLMT